MTNTEFVPFDTRSIVSVPTKTDKVVHPDKVSQVRQWLYGQVQQPPVLENNFQPNLVPPGIPHTCGTHLVPAVDTQLQVQNIALGEQNRVEQGNGNGNRRIRRRNRNQPAWGRENHPINPDLPRIPRPDGPHGDPPDPFDSDSSFDEAYRDGRVLDQLFRFLEKNHQGDIRIDVLEFDGKMDLDVFIDWLNRVPIVTIPAEYDYGSGYEDL
ncbi:hypothetical protein FRX31_026096 [Thalictrum thalictroides]|uniref:Uncharacterized protein n=1 Tax=Thalictrum thalictroides TaxID=46969 RepID=A0A7J6VJD7_THATH|nr:hypothetical protein FRX31_026096 [Thalictrum thalictroides]